MSDTGDLRERLLDLLALRFERDLSAPEERELRELLARFPDVREDDLDLAASAALSALPEAPLPAGLREKLLATVPARAPIPLRPQAPAVDRRGLIGWATAVAAGVVGLAGWWPRLDGSLVPKPPPAPLPPTLAERRAALIKSAKDARVLPLAAAGDALVPSVEGDLVFSAERQSGFMRFARGMPANNPREHVYQLWIFDATRDEHFPVDGGVFDVGNGEVIVEIQPKVAVRNPTLYAVTLEDPGGVVVSKREHILVVAKPS
ncbi:MAG: anti-sigma factor [Myxococcota bacterium]